MSTIRYSDLHFADSNGETKMIHEWKDVRELTERTGFVADICMDRECDSAMVFIDQEHVIFPAMYRKRFLLDKTTLVRETKCDSSCFSVQHRVDFDPMHCNCSVSDRLKNQLKKYLEVDSVTCTVYKVNFDNMPSYCDILIGNERKPYEESLIGCVDAYLFAATPETFTKTDRTIECVN